MARHLPTALVLAALALWIFACGAHQGPRTPPPLEPRPRPALKADAVQTLRAAGIAPNLLRCNSDVLYIPGLKARSRQAASDIAAAMDPAPNETTYARIVHVVHGHLVRHTLELSGGDNLGVMKLKGFTRAGTSEPLFVFRSGTMPDAGEPDGCLTDLLRHADVRHVVSLYEGDYPLHDWIDAEAQAATRAGATHYHAYRQRTEGKPSWRSLIASEEDYERNVAQAMRIVARLVNEQLLRPGGQAPRGNLLLHCGGGMHRTGMVFGILRRCVNEDPIAEIEAEYRYHTAYESPARPNGFEELNLRFVRDFDCGLLER